MNLLWSQICLLQIFEHLASAFLGKWAPRERYYIRQSFCNDDVVVHLQIDITNIACRVSFSGTRRASPKMSSDRNDTAALLSPQHSRLFALLSRFVRIFLHVSPRAGNGFETTQSRRVGEEKVARKTNYVTRNRLSYSCITSTVWGFFCYLIEIVTVIAYNGSKTNKKSLQNSIHCS